MEQNHLLNELVSQLGPVVDDHKELQDPVYLFMWLRHGNFNVKAAAKYCKESYRWRDEFGLATLEEQEPPHTFKLSMDEVTKDGSLIVYVDLGSMDIRKELAKYPHGHLYKAFVYYFAQAEKTLLEQNRKLLAETNDLEKWKTGFKRAIIVVNVQGMGLSHVTSLQAMKLAVEAVTTFVKYFPDMAGELVFIKTCKVFKLMFNILQPILGSGIKMHMFEDGNFKWIPKFDHLLSIEQIPESFGGSKIVSLDYDRWLAERPNRRRI